MGCALLLAAGPLAAALEQVSTASLACVSDQNPHTYGPSVAAPLPAVIVPGVGAGAPRSASPLEDDVRTIRRHDASLGPARNPGGVVVMDLNQDCLPEPVRTPIGMDLPAAGHPSDGDYDHGVGGGFFPATHHSPSFAVVDDKYGTDIGFIVGSDANGDRVLDCSQVFGSTGTSTCPVGIDGGWWVILRGFTDPVTGVLHPATTGRIFSGSGSPGSSTFRVAAVAVVTLSWQFQLSNPPPTATVTPAPGWSCSTITNSIAAGQVKVQCTPTYAGYCQNWRVEVATNWWGGGTSSGVTGKTTCGTSGSGTVTASCSANTHTWGANACDGYAYASRPPPLVCEASIWQGSEFLHTWSVNCFNDP